MHDALTVLTWNVAGRLSRLDEQADRILAHGSDVVCLQEIIPNALPRWVERLQDAGYAVAASAIAAGAPRVHRLGVLVASRHPLATRVRWRRCRGPSGYWQPPRSRPGGASRCAS